MVNRARRFFSWAVRTEVTLGRHNSVVVDFLGNQIGWIHGIEMPDNRVGIRHRERSRRTNDKCRVVRAGDGRNSFRQALQVLQTSPAKQFERVSEAVRQSNQRHHPGP